MEFWVISYSFYSTCCAYFYVLFFPFWLRSNVRNVTNRFSHPFHAIERPGLPAFQFRKRMLDGFLYTSSSMISLFIFAEVFPCGCTLSLASASEQIMRLSWSLLPSTPYLFFMLLISNTEKSTPKINNYKNKHTFFLSIFFLCVLLGWVGLGDEASNVR